jgi:cytochrome c551/c552
MKISNIQSLKRLCKASSIILFFAISLLSFQAVGQGEALFKSKCVTCHQPLKNSTGPKLYQVREKWASGGAKEGSIYQWVNNWQTAAASDPYAADVSKWSPTAMSAFPDLKKEEIDAIFDWVDMQQETVSTGPKNGEENPLTPTDSEEEGSLSWIWIFMGVVFVVIILAVGGVRRQLKTVTSENPDAQ